MQRTAPTLFGLLFSVLLPFLGLAQTLIQNDGETIFVSNNTPLYTPDSLKNNGGVVEVEGTLQIGIYSSVASSGSLINTDTVWATQGFELSGAGTYTGTGRLQFASNTGNFNLFASNGFTAEQLSVDFPATTNIDFNIQTGGLTVANGIELMGGGVVVSNGWIQDDNNAALVVDGGDTSFVSGTYRVSGTGDKLIPSGSYFGLGSPQYREVRLNGITGTGTVLAVRNFDGAGFSGSDSVGIANQFTGGDYYRVWEESAGNLAGMDSVRLNTTASDLSSASIVSAGTRIAHSPTQNGEYQTVGSQGVTNVNAVRRQISSDNVIGNGTGWYIVARCQVIAGEAVADNNGICPGENAELALLNEEAGYTYNWEQTTDTLGTWTAVPSAPNNDTLDLQDTLTTDLYFRVLYTDGLTVCADRASDFDSITINSALQARLRAMLEGPYHAAGDSMFAASDNNLFVALQDTFEAPGPGNRMNAVSTVNDTMVDVVTVELWDVGLSAPQSIDSAWINSNGYLTDFKSGGTTPTVQFCGASDANPYYVIIRHRNHMPIMSNATLSLTTTDPGVLATYDMTEAANLYQVADNAKLIDDSPVTYAMVAGNVTNPSWEGSQVYVNAMDYFRVSAETAGQFNVYKQNDVDLDGTINAFETSFLEDNVNNIISSSVPQ